MEDFRLVTCRIWTRRRRKQGAEVYSGAMLVALLVGLYDTSMSSGRMGIGKAFGAGRRIPHLSLSGFEAFIANPLE